MVVQVNQAPIGEVRPLDKSDEDASKKYKGGPIMKLATQRIVQKRLAAVRSAKHEASHTSDGNINNNNANSNVEKKQPTAIEDTMRYNEGKSDFERKFLATLSNDATENSDIVGVGDVADAPLQGGKRGTGTSILKKKGKYEEKKEESPKRSTRRKSTRRKENSRSSKSNVRAKIRKFESEDEYDTEPNAVDDILDYFGGNDASVYSECTDETGSTKSDFIDKMLFSTSKKGRERADISELVMEQMGCLEKYEDNNDDSSIKKGSKSKKSSSHKSKGEIGATANCVPEKVFVGNDEDDDVRGLKNNLTFEQVPEGSGCTEGFHAIEQYSHALVDLVCDAWDNVEPSDETVKSTIGDIETQSQAAFSVLSAASSKSYKKLSEASEVGYKNLVSLVEQAKVQAAAAAAAQESKEEEEKKDGDEVIVNELNAGDSVIIMGSQKGIEVGQAPHDIAAMQRYLTTVHDEIMEAIDKSEIVQAIDKSAENCKSPVNCPLDQVEAIQDAMPCKIAITCPGTEPSKALETGETPALADQIVDDAAETPGEVVNEAATPPTTNEPAGVDQFVDELESGISIPSGGPKLDEDDEEKDEIDQAELEKLVTEDLDKLVENIPVEKVEDEGNNVEAEENEEMANTKQEVPSLELSPASTTGSSADSIPKDKVEKEDTVKKSKKNPFKRFIRILRPVKAEPKFKPMKGSDIDPPSPAEATPKTAPVLLKADTPEKEEEGDSNIVTPKVVIRPLSEHMNGTDEPKALITRRDNSTTEGTMTPPKLSEPRSNPNPVRRNRQTKLAAKSDPKPTHSGPPKAKEDEEEVSPKWESRMVDEPANDSAWYTNFAEWDSPQEEEAVLETIAEETKESDAVHNGLKLENREQSNEAFNVSSSNQQIQNEEQVPVSESEERESPTRNYEDKSQGQFGASERVEWDDDAGAAQDRSFDTNASPSDVSQFDLATQSSQQGSKETAGQSDEWPSLPPTACEI